MDVQITENSRYIVNRELTTHLDQVSHGTTPAEQVVIEAAIEHLESTDTNPHGITPTDLDVYTKDQVDALVAPKQIFNGGGIV